MTAHAEAATGAIDPPAGRRIGNSAIFLPLFLPFGISGGYVSVTLAFLLGRAGMAAAAIAALVALTVWPQTWKVLWAPLVDTLGNPKAWYVLGAATTGLGVFAMGLMPVTPREVPVLGVLIMLSSIASTLVSMSTEVFMAHSLAPEQQGRASGWGQAGNLGGTGVGGGLGLYLAEHGGHGWLPDAVLGVLCVACCAALPFLPAAPRGPRALRYRDSIAGVGRDIWSVARSRIGFLALVMMLLPLASGAMQSVMPAIAGEWRAGADLVALVNGVAGGLVSTVGCIAGGYLCDRMDTKRAYALFALLAGAAAVAMAWAPRTPDAFVFFNLLYALVVGGGYAAYSAVVLEAIGTGSAATKFNLLASVSNVPIALMTTFDGWLHDRAGTNAMLYGEFIAPAAALAGFALLALATRRR